jgi:NADPH-dependent 2,4-dienoyl-CoA reductase/sulfur reductase-like enzyme
MHNHQDLLIVGGGPAGLSAACAARECGLEVGLVDEGSAPGGQLFRNIETVLGRASLEKSEREQGLELVETFHSSAAAYYPDTTVWGLEPGKLSCTIDNTSHTLTSSSVIIAPGGMERPVPFPGWTLPGVMSAGGADILLRGGGTFSPVADAPVVLAGNGPLLLLLADHLLKTGVKIAAWLDTGFWSKRLLALLQMPVSFLDLPYLRKGIRMALRIQKSNIPIVRGVTNIRAAGADSLTSVQYEAGGRQHEIEAGTLLRHEGIIPRTHILNSINARHRWDSIQRYWYPETDDYGATSVNGIYMAGDGCYVHGGDASVLKGRLAGIDVARHLGVISPGEAEFRTRDTLRRLRTIRLARSFLRYIFAPNPAIFRVPDETMICRCECVTAGDIRQAAREGLTNVNEIKLFTRCGMGYCQGRMCGPALAELTAAAHSTSPDSVGWLQVRQPFRPVTLENYCNLYADERH